MSESYDLSQHLLMIAAMLFYWHLLRIWHQPPPPDDRGKAADDKGTGIPHPSFAHPGRLQPVQRRTDSGPRSARLAETDRRSALTAMRAADPGFDETAFLDGASRAYEEVVTAHAAGDVERLAALIDPEVASGFARSGLEARERGERTVFALVGLVGAEIVDARASNDGVEVSVRFVGEAISATYAADGSLVAGHPRQLVRTTDHWVFARSLPSNDPNWILVATQGD